jgi:hypothetical protein
MTAIGAATMRAVAVTSIRPVPKACTVRARVALTLSGSSGMYMTWTPVEHPRLIGMATLAGS